MAPKKSTAAAETPAAPAPEAPRLRLQDLRPAKGATRQKLRVGRGRASGAGKTANRGHNGEGQRSGQSSKRGFEGGQMPGYRQMPKINGFNQINKPKWDECWLELNLGEVSGLVPKGETEITYDLLRQAGKLERRMKGVRILGNGNLDKALTLHAHHVTAGARAKIEAAGGTVVMVTG